MQSCTELMSWRLIKYILAAGFEDHYKDGMISPEIESPRQLILVCEILLHMIVE